MWFIDSWSVLDGLAFASLRDADSASAHDTVFLSVPDLEPVPVGRISTALRAQRSVFQDGFRDQEGFEFEFDNLDQIREVIRRGYLAGGLGPVPAPAEGPPPSPFRGEPETPELPPLPRDGGDYYDEEVERLSSVTPLYSLSALSDNKGREELLQELPGNAELLQAYLRAFAEATVLEYVRSRHRDLHHPGPRATLIKWLSILHALDLWNPDSAERFGMGWLYRHFSPMHEPGNFAYGEKEILFRIPCPLRSKWFPRIQTVGHKLFLPLVDRSYYTYNDQLPEFIPGLFCAMVVVLTPELAVSRLFPHIDQRRLIGRACEWLNDQLPKTPLSSAVEDEFSNFAWSRIGLNPERTRAEGREGREEGGWAMAT